MKAFVVEITTPNEWSTEEIVTACNLGIRRTAATQEKEHSESYHTNTRVLATLSLERQDV